MRKLIFIFTILLATSMAMAQTNVAVVEQIGNENEGEIVQTGLDNKAEVTQYGTNTSIINQLGEKNNATVEQGEEGALRSVTNKDTQSWRYGAFIDQVGNENEAKIKLWKGDGTYQSGGSSNGARIEQDGDNNKAFQDISNSQVKTANWDRMGAHIKQLGNENFAKQEVFRSFGTQGSGGIIIDQQGLTNQARQYVIGGRENVTEIYQIGNNNSYAGSTNADVADILSLDWNLIPVGENFSQFQRGENSELRLNILGNDNITAQYQEGTVWGRTYNIANIDIEGSSNEAVQAQLGKDNKAVIDVYGDLNRAGVQQFGDDNEAEIFQTGDSNLGFIYSTGTGHSGIITQTGNMNEAIITQNN